MKKLLAILLAVTMLFALTACGSEVASVMDGDTVAREENETNATLTTSEGQGKLGDYDICFTGYSLTKDYEGNDAIIISYDYTNNSEETTSAMFALYIRVFQDGIECERAILMDAPESYNAENEMKGIKPGATLNCQCAYVLSNTTSPIELEAKESISFNDDMVTCTYNIAEG